MPIPVLSRMLGGSTVTVEIDPSVTLAAKSGALTLTGTVSSTSRGFIALSCQLVQTNRSQHRSEAFFQFVETDGRRPTRWSITLPNEQSAFGPGDARVFGSATVVENGQKRGFKSINTALRIREPR